MSEEQIILNDEMGDASGVDAKPSTDVSEKTEQTELSAIGSKLDAIMAFLGVPEQEV